MGSQNVSIREFKPEDYDGVINLWTSANLSFKPKGRDSYKKLNEQVKNGHTLLLIAEYKDEIIGTALGTHDGRKGWINRVAVDKKFRRKKIAKRLISELESWFEKNGLEVFACMIETGNTVSMEVFKNLRYEKWDGSYFSKRMSNES